MTGGREWDVREDGVRRPERFEDWSWSREGGEYLKGRTHVGD